MEARERDLGKMFLKRGCSDGGWKRTLGRKKREEKESNRIQGNLELIWVITTL